MNRRLWMVFAGAAATLALVACGDDDDASGGDGLRVLASNSIVADWVEQVGGDDVDVRPIVPAGADLHTFQLTPGDVVDVADADLVILVGASLEGPFEDAIQENATGAVVELTEGMDLLDFQDDNEHDDDGDDHDPTDGDDHDEDHADEDDHEGHDHGPQDPHIWMDVDLAIASVQRIAAELGAADADNAAAYEERANAYVAELEGLDDELEAAFEALTPGQRLMVTFHDAYGYLADEYDLEILGFVVESADEEPSAARVADLIREMKERGATRIYLEPQFDTRAVDQIAADTGAEIRRLPSDSLAEEYPTYVAFMRAVAEAITGS